MEKGAHPQGNQRSLSHQHGLQPRDFRPGLWFRETAYGNLHRQQRDGGIMGDASSEMSKVIAKAVAFFIYIVFSYIRVSDFRIPLYVWNLLTTDEKKV